MIQGDRDSENCLSTATIAEFARHLEHFADDAEFYRAVSERAQLWVSNCFAAPVQAEAMTRIYESISGVAPAGEDSLSDWYESKRNGAERLITTHDGTGAAAAVA